MHLNQAQVGDFLCNWLTFCAESSFDAQLVERLYQNTDIMGQYLTQHLIDLSRRTLGFHGGTELGLYRGHGRLGVVALMIMRRKSIPLEIVVVPHLAPQPIRLVFLRHSLSTVFERDICRATGCMNRADIPAAAVRLVRAHFSNGVKGLGSGGQG